MVGGWQRGTHLVNGKEGSRASMETGRRSKQLSSPETMGEKTEKKKRKGTMQNNGDFNVIVYRNVDYAFIVALLMIVKDINFFYDGTWNFAKAITPMALGIMMN
ncbi:hypothetical protein LR48_Vigan567s000100 [Vigna angularis]|uniref:Uncharacterized protein n=1 Tax=Phaseolus angularis TaxID=3914 RepID=A0A0L9TEA8_PHAAN|nr:hypothetical protein LR48_Vigan567s000100 [Vigna angularis]